jgi:hypothetical protein
MSRARISRRDLLLGGGAVAAVGAGCGAPAKPDARPGPRGARGEVGAHHLPRWRGFNLWDKLTVEVDRPYLEWDFDRIAEWGFDFVRLPLDHRIWTSEDGSWREKPLREIDEAVAWARARHVHVCLALWAAPGYLGSLPRPGAPGALDLWADGEAGDEARRRFALQWRMFAERYRGIAGAELSFNLVNEPPSVSGAQYLRAARAAVDAIRGADAGRLVIADGASWGREPVAELVPLGVAQSTRGYAPLALTHYRAEWMPGSAEWPEPVWPIPPSLNAHLYGPWKAELSRPLVLRGDFEAGAVSITVEHVSAKATLVLSADGVELLRRTFEPGPGAGEWTTSTYSPEHGVYSASYGKRCEATMPRRAREIRVEVTEGDWLTFSTLTLGRRTLVARDDAWGVAPGEHEVDREGALTPPGRGGADAETLFRGEVEPWARFARTHDVGVHVGEWGVHHRTPHPVALGWMRDCLANWRRVGFGWSLWNLRGTFGVIDSERSDVTYEAYRGRRLDRRMLELLREDLAT